MANDSQTLIEQAQSAAQAARAAADAAQSYADRVAALAHTHAEHAADAAGAAVHAATGGAVDPFVFRLAIFVLAIFVGYYVVWSVTPALHTPLMSVTNAISSVIVVGALLSVGVDTANVLDSGAGWARIFGFLALILASVNIFGGFLVTERMLAMYKKKV
jgi:NAD(P) transhydrogenase subunit alpha